MLPNDIDVDVYEKKAVTPSFLEARERKVKNELTVGRVFPTLQLDGSKINDVNKKKIVADEGDSDPRDIQRLPTASKCFQSSHRASLTNRSLDSALYQLNERRESRLPLSRMNSLHVPKLPTSSPNMDHEDMIVNSRRSSKLITSPEYSTRKEKINQWFSTASEKEKQIAMNLLTAISPDLCPVLPVETMCARCNGQQRVTIKTPSVSTMPVQPERHIRTSKSDRIYSKRMNYNISDPINIGAIMYNANQYLPREFVIHPEWTEPICKNTSKKFPQRRNIPVEEPMYGYWKKKY